MKYRLRILKPETEQDNFGSKKTEYVEQRVVYAERVKQSGSRSEEVAEHFPNFSAEFNIRDIHPIDNNWRVEQLGGYLYTVTNIMPNLDRGYKTLICERVNE
jgi:head-tail adaptor